MNFIHGVFLDEGKPSFSRVFSGIVVFASLGWVTFLVLKSGQMPDLAGLSLFNTGVIAALYTGNKIASAISGTQPPPSN